MAIDPLFKLLIERTRVLATVCDNAAVVLSEQFEDMVSGPLAAVNEILERCPDLSAWDGTYNDADTIVEVYRHEAQRVDLQPVSVRVTHVPSGLAVQSYSKSTTEENEAVARKALESRVQQHWELEQDQQSTAAGSRRRYPTRPRR